MNNITNLYTDKANHIYDRVSDLHKLAKEKTDFFSAFSKFREFVTGNSEIINQFPSVSDDICLFIDKRSFDIRDISLKFDQIKKVNDIISQVKTRINDIKRLANKYQKEVFEYEKLIDDCFQSMRFGTIENYKIKLENTNKRLQELCGNFSMTKQKLEDFQKEIKISTKLWSEDSNKICNLTSGQISDLANKDADLPTLEKEYEKGISKKSKDLDDLKKFMESENEVNNLYKSDFQELKNKQKSHKEYISLVEKVNQKIDDVIAERKRKAEEERLRKLKAEEERLKREEEERLRKLREEEERKRQEQIRRNKKIAKVVGIIIACLLGLWLIIDVIIPFIIAHWGWFLLAAIIIGFIIYKINK